MDGWFPRINHRGQVVSGSSGIWLTEPDKSVKQLANAGTEPIWWGEDVLYTISGKGTYSINKGRLHQYELVEKAAYANGYAGKGPSGEVEGHFNDGKGFSVPKPSGQPAFDPSGRFICRRDDSMIEPTISSIGAIWGDGHGRILHNGKDITVAGPEARPRLVGDWLLTMTQTQLRLRRVGSQVGWTKFLGKNRNLHSDFTIINGKAHVVCCTDQGVLLEWIQDLSQAQSPFQVDQKDPKPDPKPQPKDPMKDQEEELTTQVLAAVQTVDEAHPDLLNENTLESCGRFTDKVARLLHNEDPKFGHIGKRPGQTQFNGHAVDAVAYKDPALAWDIIGGAEGHPNPGQPKADLVDLAGQPWMAPEGPTEPQEPSEEPPPTSGPTCRCDALEGLVKALQADLSLFQVALQDAGERLAKLESKPPQQYVARVEERNLTPNPFRPHNHGVTVKIDPV